MTYHTSKVMPKNLVGKSLLLDPKSYTKPKVDYTFSKVRQALINNVIYGKVHTSCHSILSIVVAQN